MKRGLVAAIAGAAVVALVGVWWFAVYSPRGAEVAEVREELDGVLRQRDQLEGQLTRLRELDADTTNLEAEIARLSGLVPERPDLAGLILAANQIALDAGIEWQSVTPSPPQPTPGAPSTVSLTIQIEGGFFQVVDYLVRLERLDRLVVVDGISITSTESDTGALVLGVSITARTFTQADAPGGTAPPTEPETGGEPPPTEGAPDEGGPPPDDASPDDASLDDAPVPDAPDPEAPGPDPGAPDADGGVIG